MQPSHSLWSPSPLALNLSQHPCHSNESALHIRWLKYWSFSFSVSSSNEYSRLISFRINWFDLLAVQEFSPAPQFESINSSTFRLLNGSTLTSKHNYWKETTALTTQTFVGKVTSLLFNMLSRFVIAFFEETSVF